MALVFLHSPDSWEGSRFGRSRRTLSFSPQEPASWFEGALDLRNLLHIALHFVLLLLKMRMKLLLARSAACHRWQNGNFLKFGSRECVDYKASEKVEDSHSYL